MWPFKSKYDKLKREDVVDAICKIEKEASVLEEEIKGAQKRIDDLMALGRKEKARDVQLYYAKKINSIKEERQRKVKRADYLMYNVKLLDKLKMAIDDNQFFDKISGVAFGKLLADQKGLTKFLQKTLNIRADAENTLVEADNIFDDVESSYEENEKIYGKNSNDDALLAMFETQETVDAEMGMFGEEAEGEVAETKEEEE